MTMLLLPLALLTLLLRSVSPLPEGAPTSACTSLLPKHPGATPQLRGAPYELLPRRTSEGVQLTLTSTLGVRFQGFVLQGRTPRGEVIGHFEAPAGGHTIDCFRQGDTVTHDDPKPKESLEVLWKSPQGYEGTVIFNSTIAQDYSTFWVGVQSAPVEIFLNPVTDRTVATINFNVPRITSTSPPMFRPAKTQEPSTDFDPFYTDCSVSKLCFGAPAGCEASKNCKAVVAVSVLVDRYEFEMKATGNPSWVAVGLSDDSKMGDDSVIECAKTPNNKVDAFMSYTSGIGNYGAERLSNSKLGIELLSFSTTGNGVYCKVARNKRTTVKGRVYDLEAEQYNLLVAAGSSVTNKGVTFHDLAYQASGQKRNLADVAPLEAASKLLVRLHGSFMVAAWIGTASIGMLLARYFRKTWTEGSLCGKDLWFAWHRIFMVLTWSLTMVGFILIFLELKAWSGERNPHAILGTITTIICFIQPIGAYFRPHPGTSKRPIFNWLHWLCGNIAHILAIVTMFFAVRLTKAELPEFVDWILVAFVAFHVIMHIILSITNCISEKNSESKVTSLAMKDFSNSSRNALYPDRGGDAPHATTRKFLLGFYIFGVLFLTIALIVIVVLAPIEETWETVRSSMMT